MKGGVWLFLSVIISMTNQQNRAIGGRPGPRQQQLPLCYPGAFKPRCPSLRPGGRALLGRPALEPRISVPPTGDGR